LEIPVSPDTIALVKSAATPAAIQAVDALSKRLANSIDKAISGQLASVVANFRANFGPHLEATYEKCTHIKTLVNRDEPVALLDQYVALDFSCNGKIYDDFETISKIRERKRVVISGTGGGGKTIFTKYIWLSLFENPNGQIPLFIELRRLNDFDSSSDSLLTLIYHSVVSSHAQVKREVFDKGVSSGLFAFVLDGFDEVALEKKEGIQKQILSLAGNNPRCIVIVSGRPDDAFDSWQSFSNFKVQPLSKTKVVQLIQKLDFDKATKKKFVSRVKADLYKKHVSFLSTPLLATLMLLTFQQFADIPEKIHLFYEQAFETLFARHDAMKETFKRDTHSKLSIDVFKRYFSYFCLVSYYDQKYEFTDSEIKHYLEKGLQIEGASIDVDAFIKDLLQSICVIQRDGLKLVFTHRSFQEFFAAYCLSRLEERHFRKIVESIAGRQSDTVLQMLYDMNEERLETEFLLPAISDYLAAYAKMEGDTLYKFLNAGGTSRIAIRCSGKPPDLSITFFDGTIIRPVTTMLFEQEASVATKIKKTAIHRKKDREVMLPLEQHLSSTKGDFDLLLDVTINQDGTAIIHGVDEKPMEVDWFGKTGFADFAKERMDLMTFVKKSLTQKTGRRDSTIKEIFGPAA
jgi:hypothetical protein